MSSLNALLALSQAPVANEYKSTIKKEVTKIKYQLKAIMTMIPDNKEELVEEKDDWCHEWHKGLVSVQIHRGRCESN